MFNMSKRIVREPKLKKYICSYYGWISSYGDWDSDDFVLMAYNKKEAIQKSHDRLKNTLLKGLPYVQLLSTYTAKMKAYEPKLKKQMEEINNLAKEYKKNNNQLK